MLYRPVVDRVIDISLHWIVNIYNTSYTILRLVIYIWLLVKLLSMIVFHFLAKLVAKSHVCNCQWENDILSPGSTWCRFSNLCLKSFGFSVLWMHNCQCYEVNQIKTVYMHKRTKSRRERERERERESLEVIHRFLRFVSLKMYDFDFIHWHFWVK